MRGAARVCVATALAFVVVAVGCVGVPAPVQLRQADDGRTTSLAVGQRLEIVLDANPTTGYQWALDGALPPQLQQVGDPKFQASSQLVGAGGTEVWTFVGKQAGPAQLKLKYWRSFEPTAPPVETFTAEVVVR